MRKNALIYVAGHRGLVGSAIKRCVEAQGFTRIITKTSQELDLCSQAATEAFFRTFRPEYVFLAAAKVGGILANLGYPAEFIYNNLMIEANVIHAAHTYGVKKLLFLGSSCIYPKLAPQPLTEDCLLSGELEPTNQWYAVAKIAGLKMCQAYRKQYGDNFIAVMPTNAYGLNDTFDIQKGHVLPALLHKFHAAKVSGHASVVVWGSGHPRREFIYADDLAEACCFLMHHYSGEGIINVGTGVDLSIRELAEIIREVVGYKGEIVYDTQKPDGTPVKRLDVSKINALGWQAKTDLKEGIARTYAWFQTLRREEQAREKG